MRLLSEARPALPLPSPPSPFPYFFPTRAGTSPGRLPAVPGLLDVSGRGPEPRGRGREDAGAPPLRAGVQRGQVFRYLPANTGKSTRAVPRTGLGRPGKAAAAREPAGQPPTDTEPGRGRALPALPSELPA